jgi:hypothetical protein
MGVKDHCSCCGERTENTGGSCHRCYQWSHCSRCGRTWCIVHHPDFSHTCLNQGHTITITPTPLYLGVTTTKRVKGAKNGEG